MPRYISKRQQIDNVIQEIKSIINANNVIVALPLLKWTLEKIKLSYEEYMRQQEYINSNKSNRFPRYVERGKIYRANLGKNVGSEQDGTSRPVLVVQNQKFNTTSTTVLVIPLTDFYDRNGNPKRLMNTHVEIEHELLDKKSIIKVELLKSISKNRLKAEVCNIGIKKMGDVENRLKLSLGLK